MVYIPTGKELIDPFKVIEAGGVGSGMKVADYGCGTLGHYVFPAAHHVGPDGKVFAIDILKSVLNGIQSRAKLEGVSNVETLWADIERDGGIHIADNTVDVGLLINNLFLSKQHEVMVRECVRTVKPGGKFVIVDWKPSSVSLGPDTNTRVEPERARSLGEAAGLELVTEFEPGKYHYGFVFKKP